MTLFEETEKLFEVIEEEEAKLEKIKIEGSETADIQAKKEVALALKKAVSALVNNVAASGGDMEEMGGALVMMDLLEILKRYQDIFDIPQLPEQLSNLEKMWEASK